MAGHARTCPPPTPPADLVRFLERPLGLRAHLLRFGPSVLERFRRSSFGSSCSSSTSAPGRRWLESKVGKSTLLNTLLALRELLNP